jgi:hypothetical protein
MTRSILIISTLFYCSAIFATAFLLTKLQITPPFGWFICLAIAWGITAAFFRFHYFPQKGYDLDLGFQALNVQEQISLFNLLLLVPLLIHLGFIFGPATQWMLFTIAFALSSVVTILGAEAKIKSLYSNVNEKTPPILMIHYSRIKAWIRLLVVVLLVILPMVILLVVGYTKSGFQPLMFLSMAMTVYFIWLCRDVVRRLKHQAPVLTVNSYCISYESFKDVKLISWNDVKEIGWIAEKNSKFIIIQRIKGEKILLDVSGLELEPASIHVLMCRYYDDYVKNEMFNY